VDKKLANEFDSHLKTVMLNLSNALRSQELSLKEKNAEVLKSKYFLYDVCFEKALSFLSTNKTAQEQPVSQVLDQIRQGTCACFVYMS